MIQELMERVSQYYTGFINLPIEGQIITGIGLVFVLAALKNVWGLLYPVRWTAASLLRVSAFLIHPRKKKIPKVSASVASIAAVPFDFSTKEKAQAAYIFYATTDAAHTLTQGQMEVISKAIALYELKQNGGLNREWKRREMREAVDALQVSTAPVIQPDTSALEARITSVTLCRRRLIEKVFKAPGSIGSYRC